MSPDRWRRIEAIFDAARARPRTDREAYVAEASAGDESLRREIMSLLEQPSSEAFIDGTVSGVLPAETITDASVVGRRVGAYEVTGLLWAGGMGHIYRARDTPLGRDVALKVLSLAGSFDAPTGKPLYQQVVLTVSGSARYADPRGESAPDHAT